MARSKGSDSAAPESEVSKTVAQRKTLVDEIMSLFLPWTLAFAVILMQLASPKFDRLSFRTPGLPAHQQIGVCVARCRRSQSQAEGNAKKKRSKKGQTNQSQAIAALNSFFPLSILRASGECRLSESSA